jgi:hypothetical protein
MSEEISIHAIGSPRTFQNLLLFRREEVYILRSANLCAISSNQAVKVEKQTRERDGRNRRIGLHDQQYFLQTSLGQLKKV